MSSRFIYGMIVLLTLSFLCGYASADGTNMFTGGNASAAIAAALAKSGIRGDIQVNIANVRGEDEIINADQPISAEIDNLSVDSVHSRWKATLMPKAGGRNLAPINLSGTYEEMGQVPVLKRQVASGEVIAADDIDFVKEPVRRLRKSTITDTKELVGKSPKRVISAGRPIRLEEIASPPILLKGAHIAMVYRGHNLEIKTLGEALDNGAKGDVIRIRNLSSKAIVDGVVETGDLVRVTSPEESDSAEITP